MADVKTVLKDDAQQLLSALNVGKYQNWVSTKLIITVLGSVVLAVLLRHHIESLTWALVTFWSVFLITRMVHDCVIKVCDTSTHNTIIRAVAAGKISAETAAKIDGDPETN